MRFSVKILLIILKTFPTLLLGKKGHKNVSIALNPKEKTASGYIDVYEVSIVVFVRRKKYDC
jgi:hypothetical protein